MKKPDQRTLNKYRALFHEENKLWCPEEAKRLKMFVEGHFVQRLHERFQTPEAALVIRCIFHWIKTNYDRLREEDKRGERIEYKLNMSGDNRAIVVLFSGTVRIRTCFKPGQEE